MSAPRHLSLRWLGAPLLLIGVVGLVVATAQTVTGAGSWHGILVYVGATMVSLGTFGVHNDTGIAYLVRADRAALSAAQRAELEEELARDRAGTLALEAHPWAAAFVTLLALVLHGAGLLRLLSA